MTKVRKLKFTPRSHGRLPHPPPERHEEVPEQTNRKTRRVAKSMNKRKTK